jgi:predicted HicB family RNase H-like nuclease
MAHSAAEMPKTPRRTEVSMSIRVRPEIAEEVRANAAAARRSINREVELYIEEALERRRQGQRPPA